MKHPKRVALTVTYSFFFLVMALTIVMAEEEMHAGFGISHYNLHETMNVTTTKEVAVARIYNTGDFEMTIKVTWIPNNNSIDGLDITTSTPIYLTIDESKEVYLKITAKEVGEYSGAVDFNCNPIKPQGYTGNPAVPEGTVNCNFTVVERQRQPTNNNWIFGIVVSVTIIACLIYWRKRRKH